MAAMRAWWDRASTAVINGKTQLALLLLFVSDALSIPPLSLSR